MMSGNRRSLERSNHSAFGRPRKQFKSLPVNVQKGSPNSPQSQYEWKANMENSSQGCSTTPKTSRIAWQGLRSTLAAVTVNCGSRSPTESRCNAQKNLLLNTSYKPKFEALPVCVPSKVATETEKEFIFSSATQTQPATAASPQKPLPWPRLSWGKPDNLEETLIESTPYTQLTTNQTFINQSLTSSGRKKIPKPRERCVKGGFADEFRELVKKMHTERRYLQGNPATRKPPSHTVIVLDIRESFGVYMARVQSETEPEFGPTIFNVIINSTILGTVSMGSRLELYDVNSVEPFILQNKEIVYLLPYKIVVL